METVKNILLGIGALIGGSIIAGTVAFGVLLGGVLVFLFKTLLVILGLSGLLYMGAKELQEERRAKKSDSSTKSPPP